MARMFRKASLLLAAAATATAQMTGSEITQNSAPPARGHSVEVVDEQLSMLYIHAGKGSSAKLDDLWKYDVNANSWTELTPTSATKPSARENHVAAMDASNKKLLIHGGSGNALDDDLWAYDVNANSWTELTPTSATKPSAREHHVAAMDTSNGKLYIHGGFGGAALDDLWVYDLNANSWTELTPTSATKPSAREKHVAAMDTSNGKLYIHAGKSSSAIQLDDIWVYDLNANSWTDLTPTSGNKPVARDEHVAAMDTFKSRLLIHGGHDGTNYLDDLWRFDLVGNTWSVLQPGGDKPSGRHSHVASLIDSSRLVVFGGVTGPDQVVGDLWQFAWVTSTSTTTSTVTNTTTVTATVTTTVMNTTTTMAMSTTEAKTEVSAAWKVCAPSLLFPLFCVASLATM